MRPNVLVIWYVIDRHGFSVNLGFPVGHLSHCCQLVVCRRGRLCNLLLVLTPKRFDIHILDDILDDEQSASSASGQCFVRTSFLTL